jgi:valyl-tRNA synthetase
MKKIILLFMGVLAVSVSALAQAYEGSIQYDKKKQQAIAIDYNYSPEAVQNAIVGKLQKMGYKPKEEKGILNRDKGFLVFKNAYVTDISKERMDYFIKVERKSRKESDESTLYLVMNKDGVNAMEKMEASDIGKAKSFLNDMLPDIEAADLEIRIKDQEETVAKAEKKMSNLKADQASLEKKLNDNKTDQEATQKDIEAQKQALGVLTGKRKTN